MTRLALQRFYHSRPETPASTFISRLGIRGVVVIGTTHTALGMQIPPPASSRSASTYNFHGLFSIGIVHEGLDRLMREELAVFLDTPRRLDLTVEAGEVRLQEKMLSTRYSVSGSVSVVKSSRGKVQYGEGLLRADPGIPPELLLVQWVENLMRQKILARRASLVHASAVSRNGVGYLFPAWAHTGKTNVALHFLSNGYDYMADDWCFVSASGEILAYPRWLNLFAYNFECHPFLVATVEKHTAPGLRGRLAVTSFAESLDGSGRFSRRLKRWLKDRFFVQTRIPATLAVPGCSVSLRAALSNVCLLVTTNSGKISVRDVSADELAHKVALCGQYERSPFRSHQLAISYGKYPDEWRNWFQTEKEVLAKAFGTARCIEVTLPTKPTHGDLAQIRQLAEGGSDAPS